MLEIKKQELKLGKEYFSMIEQLSSYFYLQRITPEVFAFLYANPKERYTEKEICDRLHIKSASRTLSDLRSFNLVSYKTDRLYNGNEWFQYSGDLSILKTRGDAEKLDSILHSLKDFISSSMKFNTVMNLVFKIYSIDDLLTPKYGRRELAGWLCNDGKFYSGNHNLYSEVDFETLKSYVNQDDEVKRRSLFTDVAISEGTYKEEVVVPIRHVENVMDRLPNTDMRKMYEEMVADEDFYNSFCKTVYRNWKDELHWVYENLEFTLLKKLNDGAPFSEKLITDTVDFYISNYDKTQNVKRKIPQQAVKEFSHFYFKSFLDKIIRKEVWKKTKDGKLKEYFWSLRAAVVEPYINFRTKYYVIE